MVYQIKLKPLHIICYILFLAKASGVIARCQLQEYQIRNEWRVVVKYQENQELKLLREMSVEDGTVLYMICSDQITEVKCENGQFDVQLPLPFCQRRLQPQMKIIQNLRLCPYTLYSLGFQISCKDDSYFFETYKVCFHTDQMRAVFTINEAYPYVLRRPDGMRFDPDNIFTMRYFSAYNKRDIYAQFKNLLGSNQCYMPNNAGEERIDRGHLTPVADFMMNSLIASTFKMINVIPQFHSINNGNWRVIEEWTRNPINTPSKVCSGALSWVLELSDAQCTLQRIYLRDNYIPIPLWTYKIVMNRHNVRTVFLTYNNIHDTNVPPQIPNDICHPIQCPSNIYLQKLNYYGYTYCCNDQHFLKNTVPNLQGYC